MIPSLSSLLRSLVITSSRVQTYPAISGHWNAIQNRQISLSAYLCAEPLKKKKKMDPAIIRAREERKKRKLERAIRRLERHQSQLKPLDELEIPVAIVDDPKSRERRLPQLTKTELESRWLLQKEWSQYKFQQHSKEIRMMEKILNSQEKALNELKLESEELYLAAIQTDPTLLPIEIKGPVETPPNPDYVVKEGDFIDVSRKWE